MLINAYKYICFRKVQVHIYFIVIALKMGVGLPQCLSR